MFQITTPVEQGVITVAIYCEPCQVHIRTWRPPADGWPTLAEINTEAIIHYTKHHMGQPADDWPGSTVPPRPAAPGGLSG